MAVLYRTKDGEMLDEICIAQYGLDRGYIEKVLDANPGLADQGPRFPAGLQIILPEVQPPATKVTRLWE